MDYDLINTSVPVGVILSRVSRPGQKCMFGSILLVDKRPGRRLQTIAILFPVIVLTTICGCRRRGPFCLAFEML